ncbi:uroporphyrinogen-III synthase [Oceanicola sp. S124]|uniref:uroporphyrinogen-III synthase n=1 Tax=Oceanicola sp. S124 TaxID=1042378 RepID=UPI00025596C1|nr:uroporphyrinogen-III synthase [Oceanicola sp. S124]
MPQILITRPEPEASALAAELAALHPGVRLVVSPLQGIRFHDIPRPDGVPVFTSRNGVRAYLRAGGQSLQAWCVGDATAALAEAAGMQAISAGGDAEALIALLLERRPEGPLVHVRGAQHRGELVARLAAGGLRIGAVEGYAQVPLPLSEEARAALLGAMPVVVPLYSPGAARRFAEARQGTAPLLIGAISAAALAPVKHLETFRRSHAAQPDGESMLKLISGLIAAAHQLEAEGGED